MSQLYRRRDFPAAIALVRYGDTEARRKAQCKLAANERESTRIAKISGHSRNLRPPCFFSVSPCLRGEKQLQVYGGSPDGPMIRSPDFLMMLVRQGYSRRRGANLALLPGGGLPIIL